MVEKSDFELLSEDEESETTKTEVEREMEEGYPIILEESLLVPALSSFVDDDKGEKSADNGICDISRVSPTSTSTSTDSNAEKVKDDDGITSNIINDSNETTSNNHRDVETNFELGDHIYRWCSVLGIPYAFTHHGIVIDRDDGGNDKNKAPTVTILDFSWLSSEERNTKNKGEKESILMNVTTNLCESKISTSNNTKMMMEDGTTCKIVMNCCSCNGINGDDNDSNSILRSCTIEESYAERAGWMKVKYNASVLEMYVTRRSGTVSRVSSDPVDTVLNRTKFLIRNQHNLLSSYDTIRSNCEHVAVWCKTGQFSSLQLLSGMSHTVALSTAPTIGVSTATTTIPSAGLWGWLGYTTTVPLVSVMPWLIPVSVVPSVVSVGNSVYNMKRWKQTTDSWNSMLDEWKQTTDDNNNNNESDI